MNFDPLTDPLFPRGYDRLQRNNWHLRIITNRAQARTYLSTYWPHLPRAFFDWLERGTPGTSFVLRESVHRPELWIIPPEANERTSNT